MGTRLSSRGFAGSRTSHRHADDWRVSWARTCPSLPNATDLVSVPGSQPVIVDRRRAARVSATSHRISEPSEPPVASVRPPGA
ncbi:hypothetical protein ACIBQ6_13250 [Nonomuraea sp. NPDC049655]|uniref:hypothetical protein n=1 Tax=Nonomuraea sp. NPDC049655 TaxID=3364355 RepID=UPI0037BACF1B